MLHPYLSEEVTFQNGNITLAGTLTGMLHFLESMRNKGKDSVDKTLWINEALQWGVVDGSTTPLVSAATWFDEGSPWAVVQIVNSRTSPPACEPTCWWPALPRCQSTWAT